MEGLTRERGEEDGEEPEEDVGGAHDCEDILVAFGQVGTEVLLLVDG